MVERTVSAILRRVEQLEQHCGLETGTLPRVETAFPLKVPARFARRMDGSADDPLLRQVLPVEAEHDTVPGFSTDAVGDRAARRTPMLLHKYHGRALVMLSPRCHIHCRFCFRRHYPYEETLGEDAWQATLDYLRRHEDIHEVILSGGDPFTLSEPQLTARCRQLESIEHLRTLRVHSRTPVVAPDLAPSGSWLEWAAASRLQVAVMIHCNHPDELAEDTAALFARYRQAGLTLLNQSVLLRGVNDDETTLERLSHTLWGQGVLPCYLHLLDRVQGTAHFEVDAARGRQLIEYLHRRLPGYLVPRLVREEPGAPSKTPVEAP